MQKALFQIEPARGARTIPGTRENLFEILNSPKHNKAIADGRAATDEIVRNNFKRNLAGASFSVESFENSKRNQENAIQGDLVALDYDHLKSQGVDNIKDYYDKYIHPKRYDIRLVWAYITFSKDGLRLVVKRPVDANITQTQKWVSYHVGLKEDEKCQDTARLFFLPRMDETLFMDEEALFGEKELPTYTIDPIASSVLQTGEQTAFIEPTEVEDMERFGIKMKDLTERIVEKIANHPLPLVEGERNDTLLKAACKLQKIDSDPNVLVGLLMNFGLDKAEVTQIVRSSMRYKKEENDPVAPDVRKIIRELRIEAGLETSDGLLPCRPIPSKLPIGIAEWVNAAPKGFAPAVIISILPLAGTIATGLRFNYVDGQEHSLSFMSHIVGEFASGKSFMKNVAACFLSRIRKKDAAAREMEDEYQRTLRRCKDESKLPEDPRPVIIEVPVNISIAKLLKRMAQAQGRHLIKVCDEIDTSTKANKAGAWSEHSDIDRYAFDNSYYGKDNIREDTYSGIVQVYCNSVTAGTYNATRKHYEHHVENGLVSRTCFAQLPSNFAGEMPVFKAFTTKQKSNIERAIDLLEMADGKIKLPKLSKAIYEWIEEKKQLTLETMNDAVNAFFRRAGVIGFRAGALAYVLNGSRETQVGKDFALWVADYVLQQQVYLWGSYMEKKDEFKLTPLANTYQELPEEFTRKDLINLRLMNGQSDNIRMIIKRWKDRGLILQLEKNLFRKVSLQTKG